MYLPLIKFFADYFLDENKNGYNLLCSKVCVDICYGLYLKFVSEGIPPIESIDIVKKKKCWDEAGRYYYEKDKRIMASKAAYVLQLITSDE